MSQTNDKSNKNIICIYMMKKISNKHTSVIQHNMANLKLFLFYFLFYL